MRSVVIRDGLIHHKFVEFKSDPRWLCRAENSIVFLIFHEKTVSVLKHLLTANKPSRQVTTSSRVLFDNMVGAVVANKLSVFYALQRYTAMFRRTQESCSRPLGDNVYLTLYHFSIGFNIIILFM